MQYIVKRYTDKAKSWAIWKNTPMRLEFIARFKHRREAIDTARLLAGWRGSVHLERKGA